MEDDFCSVNYLIDDERRILSIEVILFFSFEKKIFFHGCRSIKFCKI